MNLQDFISKYNGKKVDWDGVYGGQCVDLFRQYHHEVLGKSQPRSVVGAADFWNNYDTDVNLHENYHKIINDPDLIPQAGDVVIWSRDLGNGYGHIGVANGEGDTNTFKSFDQNWKTLSVCEIISHNYSAVYGVFRPKGAGQPEPIMSELHEYLGVANDTEAKAKLKEHLGENNSKCDWGNEADGRGGHLGSARRKIKELEENPITPEPGIPNNLKLNGVQKTYVKDGVTISENYAVEE